jgi:hypothetical protein
LKNSKIFDLKTLRIKLEENLAKSGEALREIATTGNPRFVQLLCWQFKTRKFFIS